MVAVGRRPHRRRVGSAGRAHRRVGHRRRRQLHRRVVALRPWTTAASDITGYEVQWSADGAERVEQRRAVPPTAETLNYN